MGLDLPVEGAADAAGAGVLDVGVDHGGADGALLAGGAATSDGPSFCA